MLPAMVLVSLASAAAGGAFAAEAPRPAGEGPEWKREIERKLERRISFDFNNTPFTEAVAFLQVLTKLNMIVDPRALEEKGNAAITLSVKNEILRAALERILWRAGLWYGLLDGAVFIAARERIDAVERYEAVRRLADAGAGDGPDWERDIRRMLDRKVSFEFVETPLPEAVQFLQTLTKSTFVLDPKANAGGKVVTLKVTNMPLGTALRWIFRSAELDYALLDEAVFISTPKRLALEIIRSAERAAADAGGVAPDEPEWKRLFRERLLRKVSFELAETPLDEAMQFLQAVARVSWVVEPDVFGERGNAPVTLKVTNMRLDRALAWVARIWECDYVLRDGAIRITKREEPEWKGRTRRLLERKVSFEFAKTPLNEAVQFLQMQTAVNIVLDPRAAERAGAVPVTMRADRMSLWNVLERLLEIGELEHVFLDEALFMAAPAETAEILWRKVARVTEAGAIAERRKLIRRLWLKPKRVSFELAETPLSEAIQFFHTLHKTNMILDPDAVHVRGNVPVTLKLTNVDVATALDWIVRLAGLDYDLLNGAIYIATPEFIRGQATKGRPEDRMWKGAPAGDAAGDEDEAVF